MEPQLTHCAVCNQAADLKCTGCQLVAYCGKEHQKAHWKKHKDDCKPYQVVTNRQYGRHLIASRDIKAGDTIISELPLIIGPKTHQPDEIFSEIGPCVGCYRPVNINRGERCPNCDWPICSSQCIGLTDAHHHAAECVVLRLGAGPELTKLGTRYFRYSALLLLRCLIMQRKFAKKWNQLLDMKSHAEDRKEGTEAYREAEDQIGYLNENYLKILHAMEEQSATKILDNTSTKLMHQIVGILDVNSLDVHLNTGVELSALYPTVCLLEHSCLPNTNHTFDVTSEDAQKRFRIILRAATNIKKGEHITTMYSHALWGTRARREHLLDTKYFKCTCERCRDPTELGTFLSALKCMGDQLPDGTNNRPCNGIQLPIDPLDGKSDWSCNECIVRIKSSDVDFVISQIAEDVDRALEQSPSVNSLEQILEKLSMFLHPNHYLLYKLKHTLVQLYGYQQGYLPKQMTDEQLRRKIAVCKDLLAINSKIDPYDSRLQLYTSVLLHELHLAVTLLAKREFEKSESDDRKQKAIADLKEALCILNRCKDILKFELQTVAGSKLNALVEESISGLDWWFKDNKISPQ